MTNNECILENPGRGQTQSQNGNIYNVKTLAEAEVLLSDKSKVLNEFYRELVLKLDKKQPVEIIDFFQKTLCEHERDIIALCNSLEIARPDSGCISEAWKNAHSICQRHESKITDLTYRLDAKRRDAKRDSDRNVIDVTAALIAISIIPNALYNWIRQIPGADDRLALAGSLVSAGLGLTFALRKELTSVGKWITRRCQAPHTGDSNEAPQAPSNVLKIRGDDKEP